MKFEASDLINWSNQNDDVMGGISTGENDICSDNSDLMCFHGTIRTENNGGFASLKGQFNGLDISDAKKLKINAQERKATGDNECVEYAVSLMDRGRFYCFGGCYFLQTIQFCNEMGVSKVKLSDFDRSTLNIMGRRMPSWLAWDLDTSDIRSFWLYAMKPGIIGDFELAIESIEFA